MREAKFVIHPGDGKVAATGALIEDKVFLELKTVVDRCESVLSRPATDEDKVAFPSEWLEFSGQKAAVDAPITKKSFFKAKGHK